MSSSKGIRPVFVVVVVVAIVGGEGSNGLCYESTGFEDPFLALDVGLLMLELELFGVVV